MDRPVIRVGILLSEGKKVLRCMERICVSQSPRLKWLRLNSFLVFSVWFTLAGTPVNSLHSCSPSFNGSARFWAHNEGKSPQSPGCLSMRMMGDVVGEFSPFLHARVRVCWGMSVSASRKKWEQAYSSLLPASCHQHHDTKHNQKKHSSEWTQFPAATLRVLNSPPPPPPHPTQVTTSQSSSSVSWIHFWLCQ